MQKLKLVFSTLFRFENALSVLAVAALTGVMLIIGRDVLGEAVIALLYLLPIGWSTARWGRTPGTIAALTAVLCFDFSFIPPFHTFIIGSPEGWLVLLIFLAVAVVLVDRIQAGLSQAHAREREAMFMYELSTALAGTSQPAGIAHTLAAQLQQIYQASMVQVIVQSDTSAPSMIVTLPPSATAHGKPDRSLPIVAARGMVGEICIWHGEMPLPPVENWLLQNFAAQGALALERARHTASPPSRIPPLPKSAG